MMNILRREGVPSEAVLLEDQAVNTWDSAVRTAEIVRGQGLSGVRVITDPLHCVRTVWAFQQVGIAACAEPAYDNPMWTKRWSRTGQFIREAVALMYYRVKYGIGERIWK